MIRTKGRALLLDWMKEDVERTGALIARALGVSAPCVWAWVHGRSRPQSHMRPALARLTGNVVTEESWLTADEREKAAEAQSRLDAIERGDAA